VRLDYAFVPGGFVQQISECAVMRTPEAATASDHYPLLLEVNE
jgi:endonuclease/exonuclease/phosphatase family metal-dependent hydrolase